MVRKKIQHILLFFPLVIACSFSLTGCPGEGDRIRFDETTKVIAAGDHICFLVPDAQDYQPTLIAINPRGIPSQQQSFSSNPSLVISNGQLCIPPSFYRFPDKGQFIVEYILASRQYTDEPRSVVVGIGISQGHIYNIPLTNTEINRPLSKINKE